MDIRRIEKRGDTILIVCEDGGFVTEGDKGFRTFYVDVAACETTTATAATAATGTSSATHYSIPPD